MSASPSTYAGRAGAFRELGQQHAPEHSLVLASVADAVFGSGSGSAVRTLEGDPKALAALIRVWAQWSAIRLAVPVSLHQPTDSGWTQDVETAVPLAFRASLELTAAERDRIVRSVVASQGIEGVTVTRDVAERLLDQALRLPLPDLDLD